MRNKISAIMAAAALSVGSMGSAHALNLDTEFTALGAGPGQTAFNDLSATFAPMIVYRAVKSPTPTGGLIGVDANLDITMVDAGGINDVLANTIGSTETIKADLPMPKGHVHVSLPFGLSAGMFSMPEVEGISASGMQLQYAFLDGDLGFVAEATYTLAAVYNTSTFTVENVMDLETTGLGVKAALGFDMPLFSVSAYTGFENVDVTGKSMINAGYTIKDYTDSDTKTSTGVDVKMGIFGFGIENDSFGSSSTTSYKIGVGFGF